MPRWRRQWAVGKSNPMKCRKNQASLSGPERTAFVNALIELKRPAVHPSVLHPADPTLSRYDDYVEMHRNAMDVASDATNTVSWAHIAPAFFPWHRAFLLEFENDLRSIDPKVTIPYWDWTVDQSTTGSPWTADLLGGDGSDAQADEVVTGAFRGAAGNWPIRIKDGGEADVLVRQMGEAADAANLPSSGTQTTTLNRTSYDGPTYNDFTRSSTQWNHFRVDAEYDLHNLVHRYVGGNMVTGSSPNDPVFWLHHCNIDRLWAHWQRQHPTSDRYVPSTGAPTGHNETDTLIFHSSGPAPFTTSYTPAGLIDHHAIDVWYDTDPPELTKIVSVDFIDVPTGMTTFRPITLEARTCVALTYAIVGGPTAGFSGAPLSGSSVGVTPDESGDPAVAMLWVAYVAGAPGTMANGTVQVRVTATLGDGTTWQDEWTVDLHANAVDVQHAAVVLTLDRSYSMTEDAGDGTQKIAKLIEAAQAVVELLRPEDGIGIVRYNGVAEERMAVAKATSAAKSQANTVLANDLTPSGSTGIGGAMQVAQGSLDTALAAEPYDVQAMVVLTDGNENVTPYIDNVSAGISAQTYAVGFGTAGNVSEPALQRVTSGNEGYLLVTGAIATDNQYRLTKYFLQILAGITNAAIVVDPQGQLTIGAEHRIPFLLTEADVGADVVLLSPAARVIDFQLETPGGDRIDPIRAGAEPALEHTLRPRLAFFRFTLPAMAGGGHHAGRWHAVLRLAGGLDRLEHGVAVSLKQRAIPYDLLVHARSNLTLRARAVQKSHEPGAIVTLLASLREYSVPVERRAKVWADVTLPSGATVRRRLAEVAPGDFEGALTATAPGLYTARISAEGSTMMGRRFHREQVVTATVFVGGDRPPDRGNDGRGDDSLDPALCHVLTCALDDKVLGRELIERLQRGGVDVAALRRCVQALCKPRARRIEIDRPALAAGLGEDVVTALSKPMKRAVRSRPALAGVATRAVPTPRPPVPPLPPPDVAAAHRVGHDHFPSKAHAIARAVGKGGGHDDHGGGGDEPGGHGDHGHGGGAHTEPEASGGHDHFPSKAAAMARAAAKAGRVDAGGDRADHGTEPEGAPPDGKAP